MDYETPYHDTCCFTHGLTYCPFGMKQAVHTGPKASQEVDQPISIGTQET